jgi:hypothetical protein
MRLATPQTFSKAKPSPLILVRDTSSKLLQEPLFTASSMVLSGLIPRVVVAFPTITLQTQLFNRAIAYIWVDPLIVYEIQSEGSIPYTAVGQQYDISNNDNGSTTTGLSQCTMGTTAAGANSTKQLRVLEVAPYPGNAWGDTYTIVRVQISESQFLGIGTGAATIYPATIV